MRNLSSMFAAVLFGVVMTSGCVKIWQDNLDIRTYMISAERSGPAAASPAAEKLWIEDVSVLPPYNVRSLVLKNSDVEYEMSYYSELLMSPAENIRNELFTWFDGSGLFHEISITQRQQMSHSLKVTVLDMYQDVPEQQAVLTLKVTLLDEEHAGMRVRLTQDYTERVQAEDEDAASIIRAYNKALNAILTDCEHDIAQALKPNHQKETHR